MDNKTATKIWREIRNEMAKTRNVLRQLNLKNDDTVDGKILVESLTAEYTAMKKIARKIRSELPDNDHKRAV